MAIRAVSLASSAGSPPDVRLCAAGAAPAQNAAFRGTHEFDEFLDFRYLRQSGFDLFQRVLHVEAAAERDIVHLVDRADVLLGVSGALQGDQALKICKISYEIDCRIREGADFDKLLASYDKLVKTGEFTPKNVKNASDFESMGELCRWLEKRGFVNRFYDGETRDVVDETIKNIQSWNQRLYTNESGIGDEINQRIQALKTAAELESYYDVDPGVDDYDNYENEGFEQLFSDEEFAADLEGGE